MFLLRGAALTVRTSQVSYQVHNTLCMPRVTIIMLILMNAALPVPPSCATTVPVLRAPVKTSFSTIQDSLFLSSSTLLAMS